MTKDLTNGTIHRSLSDFMAADAAALVQQFHENQRSTALAEVPLILAKVEGAAKQGLQDRHC